MGSNGSRFGIFYDITRVVLGVLTLIAMIGIIIGIVNYLNRNHDNSVGYIVWAVVALIVAACGFWGAWKEHLLSVLIYAIVELILCLAGITFAEMQLYTRLTQIFAIIAAFIFAFMLHDSGKRNYSMPCTV